nr:unnamed protein product [Callosobruchus analis]
MRRGDREMKKFTIKGVLDNFRNSVAQPQTASSRLCDQEVQETLKTDHFQVKRVSPYIYICSVIFKHLFIALFIYSFVVYFLKVGRIFLFIYTELKHPTVCTG